MNVRFVLVAVVVLACVVFGALAKPVIPMHYPLFTQCDPRWGQDKMGGGATICQEGCAMSCVSMALNGRNYTVEGTQSNPGVLNAWLVKNHGYVCIAGDCNNLVLDAPNRLAPGSIKFLNETEKPDLKTVQSWVGTSDIAILHVRSKTHFVLLTGYDTESTLLYVNDPFYAVSSYDYDDVSDILLYYMQ